MFNCYVALPVLGWYRDPLTAGRELAPPLDGDPLTAGRELAPPLDGDLLTW